MILRAVTERSLNPMMSVAEFQELRRAMGRGIGLQSVTENNGTSECWEETPNGLHFNI